MKSTNKTVTILTFICLLGVASVSHAREINVEGLGLKKAFQLAFEKFKEEGIDPTETFLTVYTDLEAGKTMLDYDLVTAALPELNIVKPKL